MDKIIEYTANATGLAGVLLCFVCGIVRFSGEYFAGGFEALTLFNVGVGLMVFAVLLKVELLGRRR